MENALYVIDLKQLKNRNGDIKPLAVDHDHEISQIRGLLCNDCNRLLGAAKDDIETLEAAIDYLKKHKN